MQASAPGGSGDGAADVTEEVACATPRVVQGQALVDTIRQEIINGMLPPGERLAEPFLASRYGVSRVPVREALRALASEGFVILRPHGGASVQFLTMEIADEVMSVRNLIEPYAARGAAEHRTDEHLASLRGILEVGRHALYSDDVSPLPRLNTEFHIGVGRASGNSIIHDMVQQIAHKAEWVYSVAVKARACYSWDEHWAIFDAIVARDTDRAARLMAIHVHYTAEALPEAIEAAQVASGAGRTG